MTRLLTAEQVCDRFGIPSERTLRTMRDQGLVAVRLGKAYLYDESDIVTFIEAKKCRARTEDRASTGLRPAKPSISSGMKGALNASGQLAQQTAARLKRLSPGSSLQPTEVKAHASRTR